MKQSICVDEEDAVDRLEELMERAHAGEDIVITRSGEPYAKLANAEDAAANFLWGLEEEFWKAGEAFYKERLAPECVMVLPAAAGIMSSEAIVENLAETPRWDVVSFSEQVVGTRTEGLYVFAYRVQAERAGQLYEAYCSSAYRFAEQRWWLSLHQQTPIRRGPS